MKTNKVEKEIKKVKKSMKREWKNIIFNGCFALATILITILFYKNILLTSILVCIISIIGLIKWKSKITLLVFVFSAFFGAICEMTAINYGAWSYSSTNFYNIPFWLFFVWGNAGTFLYQTGIELNKLGVKK